MHFYECIPLKTEAAVKGLFLLIYLFNFFFGYRLYKLNILYKSQVVIATLFFCLSLQKHCMHSNASISFILTYKQWRIKEMEWKINTTNYL